MAQYTDWKGPIPPLDLSLWDLDMEALRDGAVFLFGDGLKVDFVSDAEVRPRLPNEACKASHPSGLREIGVPRLIKAGPAERDGLISPLVSHVKNLGHTASVQTVFTSMPAILAGGA